MSVTSLTSTSVTISISPSTWNINPNQITIYTYNSTGNLQYSGDVFGYNGTDDPSLSYTDLIPGESYTTKLYDLNLIGDGPIFIGDGPSFTTPAGDPPGQPVYLTFNTITSSGLTISWDISNSTTSPTSYLYTVLDSNYNQVNYTLTEDNGLSARNAIITGLTPGTYYSIIVLAVNQYGTTGSETVPFTTLSLGNPPIEPTGLTASNITSSSVTITWNTQSDATSYSYTLNGISVTPSSSTTNSATFTGLETNTIYSIIITAINASGSTSSTEPLLVTLVPGEPGSLGLGGNSAFYPEQNITGGAGGGGYYGGSGGFFVAGTGGSSLHGTIPNFTLNLANAGNSGFSGTSTFSTFGNGGSLGTMGVSGLITITYDVVIVSTFTSTIVQGYSDTGTGTLTVEGNNLLLNGASITPDPIGTPPLTTNFSLIGGAGVNKIAYSYDGINWLTSASANSTFSTAVTSIAWNGIMWLASSGQQISYSYNGINWATTFNSGNCFCWGQNKWVANLTSGFGYSTDGFNWIETNVKLIPSVINIASNSSIYIAVGQGARLCKLAYSYDGITWNPSASANSLFDAVNGQASGIAWNGSYWIAIGSGPALMITSSDGINWTTVNSAHILYGGNNVTGGPGIGVTIVWNGIMWVSGGITTITLQGGPGDYRGIIMYSYDGINWHESQSGSTLITGVVQSIAWNGNIFIATGQTTNSVIYSTDGIHWSVLASANPLFTIGNICVSRNTLPFVKFQEYSTLIPSNWALPIPTTVSSALDRIASALADLLGTSIP